MSVEFNKNQRIWTPFPEYYLNTWEYFTDFIEILKHRGASFIRMIDAYEGNWDKNKITIILDHHIDHYPVETEVMTAWEQENSVISSIYLFNKVINSHFSQLKKEWSLDDINIKHYQQLEVCGFEIGYHSNAAGQIHKGTARVVALTDEQVVESKKIFQKDVFALRKHFDIKTFIPHGGGEGNHLVPHPDSELDLIWAYNNRPKTNLTKAMWENFTDSSGQNSIIVRANNAKYIVNRDHLHVKAWVARNGLHHILLHPGRFGKGMPYKEYYGLNEPEEENTWRFSPALLPGKIADFPLSVPELIADWECDDGRNIREVFMSSKGFDSIEQIGAKYYLLTNCATTLRSHLSKNEICIAFYISIEKYSEENKHLVRRDKQINNRFTSFPIRPDVQSRESVDISGALFVEQFAAFFNHIFTIRPWRHMADCEIPFRHVNLVGIKILSNSDIKNFVMFLRRCVSNRAKVQIRLKSNEEEIKTVQKTVGEIWADFDNHFRFIVNKEGLLITSIEERVRQETNTPVDSDGGVYAGKFYHRLPCDYVYHESSKKSRWWHRITRSFIVKNLAVWFPSNNLEIPPTLQAIDLHEYVSHFLYCRRVDKTDIDAFRSKKLPREWLKSIEKKIDDRKVNMSCGGQLYRDYILSRPSSSLLYQYLWNTLWHQSNWSEDVNDHSTSNYSWPWSYAARAAMIAYEKTNELKYPEAILNTFLDRIAPNRDHLHDRVDQVRGRSVRSWGSNYYDEYGINKGYSSLGKRSDPRWTSNATAAGRICFPVALAIESIKLNPKSTKEFLEKANQSLVIIEESVLEFLEDCRVTSEGWGYVERPDRKQVEALNHQNSYAEALIIIGQLAGNMELVDKGISIAKYFNASIKRLESGALSWGYKGINALGDLKRSQRVEDIAHGQLNMSFAKFCHSRGVVFSRTDMTGFAKTFLKCITQGNHNFSPRVSKLAHKSGLVLKPGYADHYLAWIQLSEFDSYIREVVEQTVAHRYDLYPRNWFGSPVSALAYAWRLEKT